jgi:hypothetical protein
MPRTRRAIVLAAAVLAVPSLITPAHAQPRPAFPGAEGYGGFAETAGFTGEVYRVTSLADTLTQGTLRHAVRESGFPAGGRIVVFDVGGTIQLTSSLDIKNVNKLYIAGQTAPSPITLVGDTVQVTSSSGKTTQNIVVRNIAVRKGSGNGSDALTFAGSGLGTNLIFDHVSVSWAEDENMSVANNNTNVTVQYAINSEALNPQNHAYGSLVRPRINSNVSFHHNVYAHNRSRNPRPGTYNGIKLNFDFRNNVIYNWSDRAGYTGGSSETPRENVDMNLVGNYFIAGPSTLINANNAFMVDKNVDVRAHQSGNKIDSDRALNPAGQPNGIDNGWGMWNVITIANQGVLTQMNDPFGFAPVTTTSADDAYWQSLNHAGSFWWARDSIDTRIINDVKNNTGGIINAPATADWNGLINQPMTQRPANWDTDLDGMPDAWEIAHGLNPLVKNNSADFDNDGYSDLEEYINELGAFPAPKPIVWTGGTQRYARIQNWDIPFQPSRFDTVLINSGTATVDAVGQHAGTLRLGATTGTNGTLNVTSGWINVASALNVGPVGTGTVNQTGGMVVAPQITLGGNAGASGTYNLSGGKLRVGTLSSGTGGQFNFTGGVLSADTINLNLVNNGGTIAPGDSPGHTQINGSLTINSGNLQIEIAGTTRALQYDAIDVTSTAQLGGALQLNLLDGFKPVYDDAFVILAASSITGSFTNANAFGLFDVAPGAAMRLTNTGTQLVLDHFITTGDINHDGTVNNLDIAPFVALLTGSGSAPELQFAGDVNGDGTVNNLDIAPFVALLTGGRPIDGNDPNFAPLLSLVPEPTSLALLAFATLPLARRRRM